MTAKDDDQAPRGDVPDPVWGLSDVLASIMAELNRFLVIREDAARIVALWIIHTHVFLHRIKEKSGTTRHIFDHTVRLIVWSLTHGSGKTTLGEILAILAANAESISSLTGGVLQAFLLKEAEKRDDPIIQQFYADHGLLGPGLHTYIFDEGEHYKNTPLLIWILNAGHRHDGQIWDGKGDRISVFAPVALIRRFDPRHNPELNATVSRSILVEMQKRDPNNPEHKREQFRARNPHVQQLPALKQQIASAVEWRLPDLLAWRPEKDFLRGNRNADNWEPLVAIADLAGGDWPKIARQMAENTAAELEKWEHAVEAETDWSNGRRRWPSQMAHSADEAKLRAKERIVDHLTQVDRPSSRSDLHAAVFSRNLKASILDAAVRELEAEGTIKRMRSSAQVGRPAQMIELVEVKEPGQTVSTTQPHCPPISPDVSRQESSSACHQNEPHERPVPFTDKKIMDALHEVLGPCALDPASPPVPVHVQARRWYALERGEDGLDTTPGASPMMGALGST